MNNKWPLVEKIISGLLILFGILAIYSALEYFFRVKSHSPNMTLVQLIINQIYIWITGIISILSGIFMLANKKAGWILSIPVILSLALIGGINNLFFPEIFYERTKFDILITIGIITLIFITVIILLAKYFRIKYAVNNKDYALMGFLILIMLASELII